MPQSIPPGLTQEHVLRALARPGRRHRPPLRPAHRLRTRPRRQALRPEGRRRPGLPLLASAASCSPRSSAAARPPARRTSSCGSSASPWSARARRPPRTRSPAHKDWTEQEVGLIVADYFACSKRNCSASRYSKSDHRKALAPKLQGRSDGSIEFKHQNVSAVLVELGLPYIEGYKPRSNYQGLLAAEVEGYLDRHPAFLDKLAAAPTLNPARAH